MRLAMVMVLAAWTAAGQVFPPPPTGGAQGGSGGEAMPPAPGPLYGAVRAAGTVRAGDAVVWGDAQGRTITGVDMENSAWASTGMVAAAVAEATAGMASTQQVAAVSNALAQADAAHAARKDNPHGVTAADIGALTNEQDLAALRTYHYGSPDVVESPAEWFAFDASTGTITGFNWATGREHVVIPWEIGGVPVVKLDRFLFGHGNGVFSVIAPKSVDAVYNSFMKCSTLTSVSMPNVIVIEYGLRLCNALTTVSLPNATMVSDILQGCNVLTTVSLPNATMVSGSLQDCNSLTNVSLPNATTVSDSFYNCNVLTSVSMPNATTVSTILQDCNVLTTVSLPNATMISASLQDCNALTSVSMPNATTFNGSLINCSALTSVSLPNATTVKDSLYGCNALTNVTFSGSPPEITQYTFLESPNVTVYVDNPQATGWGKTFGGCPVVRPNLYADNLYIPQLNTGTNLAVRLVASNDWIMAIGEIK